MSAKPTDWTTEVNYHISCKMAEKSVLCWELRAPRCPGFYRLVLPAVPLLRLPLSKDYGNFIMCPATIRSESMSEQAQRRLVTNPVTGRRTSTGKPVTAWIAIRKGVTGKEFTLTSWKTEIANAGGPEPLGLYAKDAQVKPYLEQQNLGELITAEHKVLIETCESGINHRYAVVGQNLAAWRSVMKQNFSRPTWNHFLEFGINLWSWPWNYWRVQVDTSPFKKIWDCWKAVSWTEEGTVA